MIMIHHKCCFFQHLWLWYIRKVFFSTLMMFLKNSTCVDSKNVNFFCKKCKSVKNKTWRWIYLKWNEHTRCYFKWISRQYTNSHLYHMIGTIIMEITWLYLCKYWYRDYSLQNFYSCKLIKCQKIITQKYSFTWNIP